MKTNREFAILRAIGIIWIVAGHLGVDAIHAAFIWFPPRTFALALFFFGSGYFFKDSYADAPWELVKRRFRKLVIPYFIYNFCYTALTYGLERLNNVHLRVPFNPYTFFVMPFIEATQLKLLIPAWFLLQLFLLQVAFVFLYRAYRRVSSSTLLLLALLLGGALIGTTLARMGLKTGLWLPLIRMLFGLFFFYLGFLYKIRLEGKRIFQGPILFAVFALQVYLIMRFRDSVFVGLIGAEFLDHVFLPILTSLTGIYFAVLVAKSLAHFLPERDIVVLVGENSMHIAANHLLVFYLINMLLAGLNVIDPRMLNSVWYIYKPAQYWLVYLTAGVIVPTLAVLLVRRVLAWLSTRRAAWSAVQAAPPAGQ